MSATRMQPCVHARAPPAALYPEAVQLPIEIGWVPLLQRPSALLQLRGLEVTGLAHRQVSSFFSLSLFFSVFSDSFRCRGPLPLLGVGKVRGAESDGVRVHGVSLPSVGCFLMQGRAAHGGARAQPREPLADTGSERGGEWRPDASPPVGPTRRSSAFTTCADFTSSVTLRALATHRQPAGHSGCGLLNFLPSEHVLWCAHRHTQRPAPDDVHSVEAGSASLLVHDARLQASQREGGASWLACRHACSLACLHRCMQASHSEAEPCSDHCCGWTCKMSATAGPPRECITFSLHSRKRTGGRMQTLTLELWRDPEGGRRRKRVGEAQLDLQTLLERVGEEQELRIPLQRQDHTPATRFAEAALRAGYALTGQCFIDLTCVWRCFVHISQSVLACHAGCAGHAGRFVGVHPHLSPLSLFHPAPALGGLSGASKPLPLKPPCGPDCLLAPIPCGDPSFLPPSSCCGGHHF